MEKLIKFLESRHSVREYLSQPIEKEKRKLISDFVDEVNKKAGTKFMVCFNRPDAFEGIMLKHWMKGCQNIIIFYHHDPIEAGYYSAKIMLFIQKLGLNSCYVGASYKKKLFEKPGMTIQCGLAFGYGENQGKPHVNKSINDILVVEGKKPNNLDTYIRVALSAPSAMNRQRFKLHVKDEKVIPELTDHGFFAEFDFGILKYYLDLINKHS